MIVKQFQTKSHFDDLCKGYVAHNRTHENSAIILEGTNYNSTINMFHQISALCPLSLQNKYGKTKRQSFSGVEICSLGGGGNPITGGAICLPGYIV